MDNGSGAKDYRTCMQKKNIKLPTGYYFGISVSYYNSRKQNILINCVFLLL